MAVKTPICTTCGTILLKNWTHCGGCGAKIPTEDDEETKPKVCPKCGFESPYLIAIFCIRCGTKLEEEVA